MKALASSVVREAPSYETARGGQHVAPLTRRGPDGASSRHHGAAPLDTKGRGAGASPPSMIMKPPSSRAGVRAPRGAADHTVADASSLADFAEQGIAIGTRIRPLRGRPRVPWQRPRVARGGCSPGRGLGQDGGEQGAQLVRAKRKFKIVCHRWGLDRTYLEVWGERWALAVGDGAWR